MAKPRKKASAETTKVTRITASDSGEKKTSAPKASTPGKTEAAKQPATRRSPLAAMRDYFVGAWRELREVRWPNRRATWSMTGALLAFTAFFVVVILLLDSLFKFIFQTLVG